MLKSYVVGRILTDLTCYPPSFTKVVQLLCTFSPQNYNQATSVSTDTYRLLPGSTLRVRRQEEELDLSSWGEN
ncbi:hypothetical protein Plhal304r1_c001g0002091 [Plasmopara halstedii]